MTTQYTTFRAGAAFLVAAAVMATALPAAACDTASRLMQAEVNGSDLYVTRGNNGSNAVVPHRPETDMYFPRR